jgi:hypothetical protein
MATRDALLEPVNGGEDREVGGVQVNMTRAGKGRVRRVIYPAGFRWSKSSTRTSAGPSSLHRRRS